MKGTIFVALEELIQDQFGLDKWNSILKESNIKSQGIFTSGAIYPDEELVSLLTIMQLKLNKKSEHLLMIFGFFLSKYFHKKYPHYYQNQTFESFLVSIHEVIHSEVKKLNIETNPPIITFNAEHNQIKYQSKRKLCPLAFGLIKGSASLLNKNIILKHENECMKKGFDCCIFSFTERDLK